VQVHLNNGAVLDPSKYDIDYLHGTFTILSGMGAATGDVVHVTYHTNGTRTPGVART
jgi:hypothetical protein